MYELVAVFPEFDEFHYERVKIDLRFCISVAPQVDKSRKQYIGSIEPVAVLKVVREDPNHDIVSVGHQHE